MSPPPRAPVPHSTPASTARRVLGAPAPFAGTEGSAPAQREQVWADFDSGWTMMCELVAATLTWGGIGWLADRWLGLTPWLMSLGFLLGAATGFYLVYLRSMRAAAVEDERRAAKNRVRSPVAAREVPR